MIEKIRKLFVGKKKSKQTGSVFSQRLQKSCYKANNLEAGSRKKRFWERKKSENKANLQQNILPGRKEPNLKIFPFKVALLLGGFLLGAYFLITGPMRSFYDELRYFRIHEIEISGCRTTNPEGLRKYADISYEMNMLSLEPKLIESSLLKHPWVKSARVKRVWPDGLAVTIKEHRPQALLVQEDGNEFSYVSNSGVVFATVANGQELDFPVITGINPSVTADEQKRMLEDANLFLRLAERNNPNLPAQNVSEIHFTETGELVLYLVEHPFPIYFGKDEIKRKYSQLRRVMEVLYRKRKGRAEIEKVSYIQVDYQKDKVLVVQNQKG